MEKRRRIKLEISRNKEGVKDKEVEMLAILMFSISAQLNKI